MILPTQWEFVENLFFVLRWILTHLFELFGIRIGWFRYERFSSFPRRVNVMRGVFNGWVPNASQKGMPTDLNYFWIHRHERLLFLRCISLKIDFVRSLYIILRYLMTPYASSFWCHLAFISCDSKAKATQFHWASARQSSPATSSTMSKGWFYWKIPEAS